MTNERSRGYSDVAIPLGETLADETAEVRCRRGLLAKILLLVLVVSCAWLVGCSQGVPAYEIVEVQDTDFGVRRITYVIDLPEVYSEEQILQIASRLVEDRHRKRDLVGGARFLFFFPGSHVGRDVYDGLVEWAPDGDWSKTLDVTAGDYREFRFNAHVSEGLTKEEIKAMLSVPISGRVIGHWYKHGPSRGVRTLFTEEGKTYYMHQTAIDTPRRMEEVSEVPHRSGRRFNYMPDSRNARSYLVLTREGDLHFYNRRDHLFMVAEPADS